MKQVNGVDRRSVGERLDQVGQADQHQENEGYGREQRIEGERAGKERNVVFVGCLQRAGEEAGGRTVPPAGSRAAQASGSSRSAGDRRRDRASASRRSSSSLGVAPGLRPYIEPPSTSSSTSSSSSPISPSSESLAPPNC